MIRFSCMCINALDIYFMYRQITLSSKGTSSYSCSRISFLRSPLSAHYCTMINSLLWIKESMYWIIFWWLRAFIKSTSFKHFSRCFWSAMSKIFFISDLLLFSLMQMVCLVHFTLCRRLRIYPDRWVLRFYILVRFDLLIRILLSFEIIFNFITFNQFQYVLF